VFAQIPKNKKPLAAVKLLLETYGKIITEKNEKGSE